MKKSALVICFGIAGMLLGFIASSGVVSANGEQIWSKELLARLQRPNTQKPGGDFTIVSGGIYIPEGARAESPESATFLARFTRKVDFQVVVWDPKKGINDGDGIDSVQISMSRIDPTTQNEVPVYERIEKKAAYCPFGGDQPCKSLRIGGNATWPGGQLVEGGKYRARITISPQQVIWFFDFEIQPS